MKKKTALIGASILAAIFGGAVYASPHWQLYRMRAAVEARDAQALAQYVDFPRLRESAKIQLVRRLDADGARSKASSNPFAALGRRMVLAVIDPVVDAAVSPAGVAAMLDAGDIRVGPLESTAPTPPTAPADAPARDKVNYDLSYRSWQQVVVQRADGGGAAFILDRHGLWRWKLAGVELPEE